MTKMAHNNTAPVVRTTNQHCDKRLILLLIVVILITLFPLAYAVFS